MFEHVPLFRELYKVMSWQGGPVNWDLAGQTATALAAQAAEQPLGDRPQDELARAVDAAELWLDEVTALPAVPGPVRALSRQEWVGLACTAGGLGAYAEPIAAGMGAALRRQLPEELQGGAGAQLARGFEAVGAMLYGVQIGTVAGHLTEQLLGTYDLGVPTADPRLVATVGDNAQRFAADYGFDVTEFLYWVALRETAHRRQFAGVAWLRGRVADLVRQFADAAEFDPGGMLEQFGQLGIDPTRGLEDPDALREALSSPEAFSLEPTAEQRAVLEELQALVSFTISWADTVVEAAAGNRLGTLPRIEEAIRRRRAEKGPGEQFLEQLVGLDLKPQDLRTGAAFCAAVIDARGQEGLDRAWQRAEHLPTAAELAEPSRWLVRMAAAELES
jgi:putative hydrolase